MGSRLVEAGFFDPQRLKVSHLHVTKGLINFSEFESLIVFPAVFGQGHLHVEMHHTYVKIQLELNWNFFISYNELCEGSRLVKMDSLSLKS